MRYVYKYTLYILRHIYMYIFIVIHFIINYENISYNYLQINTKLKHKELFTIGTQRKDKHSNIKSEYVKNSVIGMYIYLCFQLRILDTTRNFIL
jgi:hypothetical protein